MQTKIKGKEVEAKLSDALGVNVEVACRPDGEVSSLRIESKQGPITIVPSTFGNEFNIFLHEPKNVFFVEFETAGYPCRIGPFDTKDEAEKKAEAIDGDTTIKEEAA